MKKGKFIYVNKKVSLGKAFGVMRNFCLTGNHRVLVPDVLPSRSDGSGYPLLDATSHGGSINMWEDGDGDGEEEENYNSEDEEEVVVNRWGDEEEIRKYKSGHSCKSGKCCDHNHGQKQTAPEVVSTNSMNMNADDRI